MHNIAIFVGALLFIYSSFLIGGRVIRFFRGLFSELQHLALSILLGFGFWGIIGMLLGLVGWFDPVILRLVFVLIFLVSWKRIRDHLSLLKNFLFVDSLKSFFREHTILKTLAVIWLSLTFLITFMPITGFDTLKYHLPIVQDIIATGKLTFSPEIYNYAYLPVLAEIIYAVPLTIFNNTADPYIFQLVQYSGAVLFLLLIYGFLKKNTAHVFMPIVAVLAVLSMMDFQREILHGGYIDVLMFTTAIASLIILLQDINRGKIERGNIVTSALLVGFAVAMKYLALFFLGFNGLLLAYYYFRVKTGLKEIVAGFLKYFSIPALVAGFWYLKNFLVFGDPLYPIFKGTEFSDGGWWIAGRTIGNMLLFPFLKWGEWFTDRARESSSMLVIFAYFVALYALIAFFIIARKRFTFFEVALFGSIHLFLWFMFFNSHYEGYLLGATMLVPVLLVLLFDRFLVYLKEHFSEKLFRIVEKTVLVTAGIAFLVTFAGSIHFFRYKYSYLIEADTKQEYILNIGGL